MEKFQIAFRIAFFTLMLSTAILLLSTTKVFADVFDWTGATSTDATVASNWQNENVFGTHFVPNSTDDVQVGIANTFVYSNLNITASVTWKSLTVGFTYGYNSATTGYLNPNPVTGITNTAFTSSIIVSTGVTLTVTGNVTINNYASATSSPNNFVNVTFSGAGTVLCQGNFLVGDITTQPAVKVAEVTKFSSQVNQLTITGNLVLNSNGNTVLTAPNRGICYPWFSVEKGTTTLLKQLIFATNNAPFADGVNTYNPPLTTFPGYGKFTADNTASSPSTVELKYKQPIIPADKFYVYFTYGGNNGTVLYDDPTAENQTIYTANEPSVTTTLSYINSTNPNSTTSYYNLTFSGASTKVVDKNSTITGATPQGLTVGNTWTTGGGAVNLNTNNPTVTVTGGWINSAGVTQGSGNIIIGDVLTNNSGGALNLGSGNLSIAGNYTNNVGGTYTQGTGTTFFTDAGTQTLIDNSTTGTTFKNVTFNAGGTATMSAGTNNVNFAVASTGILTMSNSSKLVAGTTASPGGASYLTLKSDVNGTAAVAAITSPAAITGNVNVQRFFTGGSTYTNGRWVYRNYRLVSSPVNAGLVSGNYPYTLNYIAASAIVSGAKSSFGTLGGNPTLYAYSEDYTPSNASYTGGNFKGITDISTLTSPFTLSITNNGSTKAMYVGNGFMFFFRGDKINSVGTSPGKTTYPYVAPESVVFTATGFLNQGSYTVNNWQTGSGLLYTTVTLPSPGNSAIKGYNMVGNPYACTIDWETVNSGGITAVNVNPTIYILNPVTNHYDSYSSSTHVGSATTFSGKIASGQGFLIQANNANPVATRSLTFNESAKSPTTQLTGAAGTLMMGVPAGQDITRQVLRLRLSVDSLDYDDMVIGFKSSASAKYDVMEDSKYLSGLSASEGLASFSADSVPAALSVNFLSLPKQTEQIIRLKTTATNSGRLTLTRMQLDSLPKIYELWLMDGYKKDSLDLRHNNTYAFDIDRNDTASFGNNRFQIIIRQNKALGVHLLDFTAVKAANGVPLTWKTENEENYTNFTVERSTDNGATFNILGGFASNSQQVYTFLDTSPVKTVDLYRLKLEDLNGAISYSQVIAIVYDPGKLAVAGINVYPNPAIGVINLAINQTNASSFNLAGLQNTGASSQSAQSASTTSYAIKIVNVSGTVVKSVISQQPYWQGDVSGFLPGTYIIQVVNSLDKSLVGKTTFVKL